jgi:hypothetical protein
MEQQWLSVAETAKQNALRGEYPASEGAIRWLIWNSDKTGFSACMRRVGRRVLLNPASIREWIGSNGGDGGIAA